MIYSPDINQNIYSDRLQGGKLDVFKRPAEESRNLQLPRRVSFAIPQVRSDTTATRFVDPGFPGSTIRFPV